MDLTQTTTADLLRLLVDRGARKRAWERDPIAWSGYGGYDDNRDERLLEDIAERLAARIDGKERGPEPKAPPWDQP